MLLAISPQFFFLVFLRTKLSCSRVETRRRSSQGWSSEELNLCFKFACFLFLLSSSHSVHFKIKPRYKYVLKMPKAQRETRWSSSVKTLINKKILCVMRGYYVRLARANNDEFINVRRGARARSSREQSQRQYFLLKSYTQRDIKSRKRRDSLSCERIHAKYRNIPNLWECRWAVLENKRRELKELKIYVIFTAFV